MKRIILVLVVALLVLVGFWYAKKVSLKDANVPAAAAGVGFIKSEETSFNFGEISMAAGKVRHEFKVRNSASEPVKITSIYSSCMCTEATLIKNGNKRGPYGMPGHGFVPKVGETMAPNEEAIISVEFDPAAHGAAGVGPISRVVAIETSDGARVDLEINALIKP